MDATRRAGVLAGMTLVTLTVAFMAVGVPADLAAEELAASEPGGRDGARGQSAGLDLRGDPPPSAGQPGPPPHAQRDRSQPPGPPAHAGQPGPPPHAQRDRSQPPGPPAHAGQPGPPAVGTPSVLTWPGRSAPCAWRSGWQG